MGYDGSVKIRISGDPKDFENTLKNLEKGAVKGLTTALTAATTAVAALGTAAVNVGKEFESAFAQVVTIMDSSVVSTDTMREKILAMSSDMGVAATELSGTVYNAISATGDTANAVSLVADATKLATAGFADTGSALAVLTTAINAYGMSADKAAQISDSLLMVQNLGVTTVAELSANMGKAIATASAYSVNLSNVESAYVSLTKAGINTAEGTTYLSSMLNELGDSGSQVSGILKTKTGKSFNELMADGNSLSDVLGILYDACERDSTALMNLWGSAEAGKASNAIVSQGLETFNKNLLTIENSAGATETAYTIMTDTFEHKTSVLKENIKNLGVAVYEDMEAPLKDSAEKAIGWVGDIADAFENGGIDAAVEELGETFGEAVTYVAELAPDMADAAAKLLTSFAKGVWKNRNKIIKAFQDVIKTVANEIGDLVPILKPVTKLISTLADNFDDLLPVLEGVAAAVIAFKAAMSIASLIDGVRTAVLAFKTANEAATISQAALNAVMNANPAVLIASAIAVLVGGIIALTAAAKQSKEEMYALSESQQALVDTNNELSESRKSMLETAAEQSKAVATELDYTQKLAEELQTLVDVNGAVKAGEEGRAKFILGELNSALGTEYTMTGNVIDNYEALETQIYNTIAAKKAELLLQAHEEAYTNAILHRTEAEAARGALAQQLAAQEEAISQRKQEIAALEIEAMEAVDSYSQEWTLNRIAELESLNEADELRLEKLQENYNTANSTIEGYHADIASYEEASELILAGHTEEAIALLENYGQGYGDLADSAIQSNDDQLESLKQNVIDSEVQYQLLKDEYERNQETMTEAQKEELENRIADAKKAADEAKDQYYAVGGDMVEGMVRGAQDGGWQLTGTLKSLVNNAVAAAKRALGINSPSKVFRKMWRYVPAGAALGVEDEAYLVEDAMKDMVSAAESAALLNRMQATVAAEMAYTAIPATGSVEAAASRYGAGSEGGSTVNNYNFNSTYNSPKGGSWRDYKLYEETKKQQYELLGI